MSQINCSELENLKINNRFMGDVGAVSTFQSLKLRFTSEEDKVRNFEYYEVKGMEKENRIWN